MHGCRTHRPARSSHRVRAAFGLPGTYKDAVSVRARIPTYGLADIVDSVEPYGSIMASDW
ncbi:hypothetical protein ASF25_19840 [Methylobacterium sp. Leaf100]|nr:hypothetical protein ASF25_19840 [Methylobacterium sp. Leaf100]